MDFLTARAGTVVVARDLEAAGIDRNAIARLRRTGRLVRLYHRTYAVPPVTEPEFDLACRGAVAYAGAGAHLLGETALAFVSAYPQPDVPDVGVPRSRHVRTTPGLRVAHCAGPVLDGATWVDGVPVQEPGRAVVWAAARLARQADRQAVVCAAVSGCATTTDAVRRALVALGPRTRGRTVVADACDHVDAGCESPAEIAYLVGVERAFALPPGERQHVVALPDGRSRRLDVRYGRVVVEIDGHHHTERREHDAVRDVMLTALGLHVVRVPAGDVYRTPGLVAATVRAALARCA